MLQNSSPESLREFVNTRPKPLIPPPHSVLAPPRSSVDRKVEWREDVSQNFKLKITVKMARSKKSKEEILARRRIAKRKRYAALKENEELYNIEKEKEKKRYLKRKAERKILGIKDLTPRAQRDRRRKWRANSKKYLNKKRAEKEIEHVVLNFVKSQDEPSEHGGHDPLQSGSSNYYRAETETKKDKNETDKIFKLRAKIRHLRYQKDKDIKILQNKLYNVKKENIKLKRLLNRYNEAIKHPKTTENRKTVQAKKISYKRVQKRFNTIKEKEIIKKIEYFFNEDENTRVVPGIKEFITRKKNRMQKRYLNDTLKNLYKKFCIENQSISVSYSFFCKLRPFWILFPKANRNTCECIYHCNSELLIKALNKAEIINIKTNHELLNMLCCDRYNETCLDRKCSTCEHKVIEYLGFSNDIQVKYYEWRRISNTYEQDGKVKHNVLWTKSENYAPPLDVIQKLENVITHFLPHCATVVVQNKSLKELKKNIQINEAVVHLDFSENYGLKHHTEVQSFHFGGSRQEVSIHTVVIYMKEPETLELKTLSVCTVSENLKHTAVAIWAHLEPILLYISDLSPFIDTLHFYSDSPSSQYRNRNMFYILTQLEKQFVALRKLTWNYMEVGHGKGAPDGLGAVVKRTANRIVNSGTDIGTFTKFVEVIRANVSKIKIFEIASVDIDEKERMLPKLVATFKGTTAVHQVVWRYGSKSNQLEMRSRSCFICEENTCSHYHLGIHNLEKIVTSQIPKQSTFEDTTLTAPVAFSDTSQPSKRRKNRSNIPIIQEGLARDIIILPAVPEKPTTSGKLQPPEVHAFSAIKKLDDWQNLTFIGSESKSDCKNFENFISSYPSGFNKEDYRGTDVEKEDNKENIVENECQDQGKQKKYKGKGVGKKSRKDNQAEIK